MLSTIDNGIINNEFILFFKVYMTVKKKKYLVMKL